MEKATKSKDQRSAISEKKPTKLSKTTVDAAQPSDKEQFIWDSELKGFGLKIFPTGAKSFVVQYRTAEGRSRRYTIGKLCDSLTADQARKIAKQLLADVTNGADPQGAAKKRREAWTVNQLLDAYLESSTFAGKADSTRAVDRGRIDRHLRPTLGSRFADMVTPDDIRRARKLIADGKTATRVKTRARGVAKVTGGPGTADKAVLALRAAYTWAIAESLLADNPAAHIKVAQPGQRDTILGEAADYTALFRALAKMENELRIRKPAADAIRFIAMTGARRGEVHGLRWEHVNLRAGIITLPPKAHKTGSRTGKPRIIALPTEAQAIIARQPEGMPGDFVFQPAKGEGPMSLTRPWQQVRKEAGLPENLGLHGLRHSLATHLAMGGASSVELMESLGHKQVSTTQRYIHFVERVRSTLAQRAASMAVAGMAEAEGKQKSEVVQIKRKQKSKTAA